MFFEILNQKKTEKCANSAPTFCKLSVKLDIEFAEDGRKFAQVFHEKLLEIGVT